MSVFLAGLKAAYLLTRRHVNSIDGVLVTCLFNPRGKRPALRIVPLTSGRDLYSYRLDSTDLRNIPSGRECRIPTLSPFALVKQVIDGIFVQINNKDPWSDAILTSFVSSALQYHHAKSVQRLGYAKLEHVKREHVQSVIHLMRFQGQTAYGTFVETRIQAFIYLVVEKPTIATWHSIFQNCQHFCSAVLESQCFLRQIGCDSAGSGIAGSHTYFAALPSTSKVLRLADDQSAALSPWFSEYFGSVERSKEHATMLSFRRVDSGEKSRETLLDLRMFGIPALPNQADPSQTNGRLGIRASESADAWFSLSAISLFFVTMQNRPEELSRKLAAVSMENGMGMLALGYFEWLERVAHYHLLNSVMRGYLASLSAQDVEEIMKMETYHSLLVDADRAITRAEEKRDTALLPHTKRQRKQEVKRSRKRRDALTSVWELEVKVPKLRARRRRQWDWFATLG